MLYCQRFRDFPAEVDAWVVAPFLMPTIASYKKRISFKEKNRNLESNNDSMIDLMSNKKVPQNMNAVLFVIHILQYEANITFLYNFMSIMIT